VDGLLGAVEVEVSPDGSHVYVASQFDDAIAVFSRDAQTGLVSFVQVLEDGVAGVDGLDEASGLLVSADGAHVYATSFAESSVSLFSRDANSGMLTFVSRIQDGVGGVDGLGGAVDVASSPAGDHVYVTGFLDQAIAIFSRDQTTGALGFVDFVAQGSGGVSGLDQPIDLVVSPDGAFAYVAGRSGFLVTFVRNPLNGFLSFLSLLEDGVGITTGIGNPRALGQSADGSLLAVADGGGRITIFGRSAGTGLLGLRQIEQNGVDLPSGIGVASAVAFSPLGGASLLATGSDDDAVALFVPEPSMTVGLLCGGAAMLLGSARARTGSERRRVRSPRRRRSGP
jgi:6-phosphogluconolactonase (cycloisomerase 2 family)